jgi:hypothetical protein
MSEHISEEDRRLMAEFASTPEYARTPEQLIPDRPEDEFSPDSDDDG